MATLTPLPTSPDPATMTQDEFDNAAAAMVLAQKSMVAEINSGLGGTTVNPNITGTVTGTEATWNLGATSVTTLSATTSILSSGATSGIGYTTGAGGTVAQATSKATEVVLNKTTGLITTSNSAIAAGASVTFVLTSSAIATTDMVTVGMKSGGTHGAYLFTISSVGVGGCRISIYNCTAGSLSETLDLRFMVFKGVSA